MGHDERLAERVRKAVGPRANVTEKKMFGGLAFLLEGKLFVGIANDDLMVRVGPDGYKEALDKAHVRPMDFTGKPMNGYVFVGPAGCRTDKTVVRWVALAVDFVATLAKTAGTAKKRAPSKKRPSKTQARSARR